MKFILSLLANVSYKSASISANSTCGFLLYEPEMPSTVKKLIKY